MKKLVLIGMILIGSVLSLGNGFAGGFCGCGDDKEIAMDLLSTQQMKIEQKYSSIQIEKGYYLKSNLILKYLHPNLINVGNDPYSMIIEEIKKFNFMTKVNKENIPTCNSLSDDFDVNHLVYFDENSVNKYDEILFLNENLTIVFDKTKKEILLEKQDTICGDYYRRYIQY